MDDAGHVVAGHWTDATGGMTEVTLGLFDDAWQSALSVRAFRVRNLRADTSCETAADAIDFTITCQEVTRVGFLAGLYPSLLAAEPVFPVRAALTLRRADLHATRLTITLRLDGRDSVVAIEEERFTEVAAADVPAGTFSPPPREPVPAASLLPAPARLPGPPSAGVELRLAEMLDRLAGNDQLSVERGPDQRLRITGLVATPGRRRQIIAAADALAGPGSVVQNVLTHAEASRDAASQAAQREAGTTRVEVRELPTGLPPAALYLAPRLSADELNAVVQDLSSRVLAQARAARLDAVALESLLQRFPERVVASLEAEAQTAWRALLSRRVARCLSALQALDVLLAPYFATEGDTGAAPGSITEAAHRLANELAIIETAIASAFTAQSSTPVTPEQPISTDFRDHIRRASQDARFIDGRIRP
jgi:hypothetical protein